jgi:magnesium transporter
VSKSKTLRREASGYEWINIPNPGPQDTAILQGEFSFHDLDLEDVLSRRQRPKLDTYPDYLFAVIHVPYRDNEGSVRTGELDLFLMADILITLPATGVKLDLDINLPNTSAELLYRLLRRLFNQSWEIIDWIGAELEDIEDAIFTGDNRAILQRLSEVKQAIIACRRIIKPARIVIKQIALRVRIWDERMEEYYDDLLDTIERMWDLLENYNDSVNALDQTNENVLAHTLNRTLLFLTIINVTLLPMTLLASFYGMNVPLPMQTSAWTAPGLALLMVLMLVIIWRWSSRSLR